MSWTDLASNMFELDSQKSAFHCFQHFKNFLSLGSTDRPILGMTLLVFGCEFEHTPLTKVEAGT